MESSKLIGSIPCEVGNLSGLTLFNVGHNELTEPIPTTIAIIGKLQGLYLQDNKPHGPVPEDICNLPSLAFLSLSSNELNGSILLCIGNLTSLGELYLGSNQLTGTIPDSSWSLNNISVLNISTHFLSGDLAPGVRNLKAVTVVDLSGDIPESFGKLVSLESLDLSSNNLTGPIPKSLESLSYLKYSNLSFNHLSGKIPSFVGNEALCGDPRLQVPLCPVTAIHQSQTKKLRLLRILPPSILAAIFALGLLFVQLRYLRRNTRLSTDEASMTFASRRRISYYEVLQATNGLSPSNLLGAGCFGLVYRGTLSDGVSIAVEVFNLELEGTLKSFKAECEVLRSMRIRHHNLVKIISSCCNLDFRAFILEYMPNGSLESWLHCEGYHLDILQRLNIMIDVASGLKYLHEGYSIPIVDRDSKPNNVLLGGDLVACLYDFGIAKLLGEEKSMTQTKTLATMVYMAPEYGSGGFVSTRGDVDRCGILLMETFTGKRPTDEMFSAVESLKQGVEKSLPHAVQDILNTNLLSREELSATKLDCLSSILELAVHCCAELPEERMRKNDVLAKLNKIKTRRTTITSEEVKSALFSKEWQRKLQDDDLAKGAAQALTIRGRKQHQEPSSSRGMKGKKVNTLYYLLGETVTGSAAILSGDEVETDEPSSYSEAMASSESSQWLGTMNNPADMMTKFVPVTKLKLCLSSIGVCEE
ncbi:probable LRR receptor-like serine/threonine-protein kinase At3g47570 [Eucalyptus grandis]|uniref:probable LRR receptor-like serine/threonine-protein kinase At3g47570 n=1 Tax=Eucalyptus grandis TaxID=71139 RepID=UPI00192E9FAE|nr:probable LRR receptor-like serine/threonine-protein kinase At3g47570 [Eucalyptus grandis]